MLYKRGNSGSCKISNDPCLNCPEAKEAVSSVIFGDKKPN
jgi:hypothetical protein